MIARNLRVAAHLWSSATAFFFVAFLFAYFYLRALDQNHLWHPHRVKAPVTMGTLIAVAVAASGIAAVLAARRLRAGDESGWRALGLGALALGLVAVVLQVVEWSSLGFGPTDGGLRERLPRLDRPVRAVSPRLAATGSRPCSPPRSAIAAAAPARTPRPRSRPGADAFAFYWAVLSGIGVATWVILYLSLGACSCFAGKTGRCSGPSTRWR